MANKKQATGSSSENEKTFFEKLGEQAAHVKEELIAGKDHLVEVAGDTIASVKSSIQEYKARKAKTVKKAAPKKISKRRVKKVASKVTKPVLKKAVASAKKKTAKKSVKKVVAGKKKIPKKSAKPAKKTRKR